MYLGILVIAIIVIAGVGVGIYLTMPKGPKNPGTIVVDSIGDAQYMDPAVDYETAGGEIIQNCYETLLFYNMTSAVTLLPVLCSSWNVSTDGTTYTFLLRHGITFTDGTPFNASVMKWSLDRVVLINDPRGPAWMLQQAIKGAWNFTQDPGWAAGNRTAIYEAALKYFATNGVEIVDNYTLRIHVDYHDSLMVHYPLMGTNTTNYGTPYAGFPYILAFTAASAISYSYVNLYGGSVADTALDLSTMSVARYNRLNHGGPSVATLDYSAGRGVVPGVHNNFMDANICGTGPYMLTEWTRNTRIVMTRNPNYWGGPHNTGIAPTPEVIINIVTDFNSRKLRMLAGDSDITGWGAVYADQLINVGTRTVLPAYAADIRAVCDLPTFDVEQLQFNEAQYLPSGTSGVIQTASVNGTAVIVGNDNPPVSYNASFNPFQFADFRNAFVASYNFTAYYAALNGFMQTLNGFIPAGMVCHSDDVPYQHQNLTLATQLFAKVGWKGSINLYYNTGSSARETACLILKDMVESASHGNVTISVVSLTWPAYLNLMNGGTLPIGDIGWLPDYADPDDYAVPYAWSGGTFSGIIFYANSTVDDEVAAAAIELNVTTRTAIYKDIDMTLYKQGVYLWLGQTSTFHVERTWVHGWMFNPMFSGAMYYYITKS
jgi:peptide/nickel transport system substrate-binding protein